MITPATFTDLGQAHIEKTMRLSQILMAGLDRLMKLNLELANALMVDQAAALKALTEVKDVPGLLALQQKLSRPAVEKGMAIAKTLYESSNTTQSELSSLVEENVVAFNKTLVTTLDKALKSAPAGSEVMVSTLKNAVTTAASSFDAVTKTAKKVSAELTRASMAAAETSAKVASLAASTPVAATRKAAA